MNRPLTYLVANWKLHMTGKEAKNFFRELLPLSLPSSVRLWIAPPYTAIPASISCMANTPFLAIGSQNVSMHDQGAYTGEVSAAMVRAEGCLFSLIGHSERRTLFSETNATIKEKIKRALDARLIPILCIGETIEEREQGKTRVVLEEMLDTTIGHLSFREARKLFLAYEPIWAIGSGRAADVEVVSEAHLICRQYLSRKWKREGEEEMGECIPILYGGSVNPSNLAPFLDCKQIDGALIGGASLKIETMRQLIQLVEDRLT